MGNLNVSPGWICLIGGLSGIITVSRAKTFSWRNYQFVGTEEDKKREESPMTPLKRFVLIAICLVIVLYGAVRIDEDHDWNPTSHATITPGHNAVGPGR